MSALKDIEHVVVGGGQDLLSLWPRHGGLWSWGNEVLAAYIESLCSSDDGGLNWSSPRRIAAWTHAPFPLRLRNGRLLLICARCAPDPTGLYLIESEDDGQRWSRPVLLRGAALPAGPCGEIAGAFPVARELSDGRVLVIYGWQYDDEDVPWYGSRSFIGGTFFRRGETSPPTGPPAAGAGGAEPAFG